VNSEGNTTSRIGSSSANAWGVVWRFAAVLGGLYAVATLTCGVIRIVNPPTKTYRFVFPEGAHGKFVLRCLVPGAPPLHFEDGFRLVRFHPGVRTIDTSDEYVFGNEWFREEHFVEGNAGRKAVDGLDCQPSPSLQHVRVDVTCELP
jgi:hypothetical protein